MQETGNNNYLEHKILSIRLSSDGLSFSMISPLGDASPEKRLPLVSVDGSTVGAVERIMGSHEEFSAAYPRVQIFIDTADTVYIPAEVASSGEDMLACLKRLGIYPSSTEKAVLSSVVGDLCAVVSFDAQTIDLLKAKFGSNASFFSPLQENIEMKGRLDLRGGAWIVNLTESNFYITSFDTEGRLQVAEAYPCASEADIVYYLRTIAGGGAKPRRIYVYGSRASKSIRTIKKYFKGAVCV